jgi:hypothetical protein
MEATAQSFKQRKTIMSALIDISAVVFIYFVPTISHLISLPLYFIEPMRMMLIFSLVHTHKNNAYLLALTLPLFSYFLSGHPVFPKMLLITFELSFNVFLFYLLNSKMKNVFPAILLSILISKLAYYLIKFVLINMAIIHSGLISTPIFIQILTTLVFSTYLYLMLGRKR